MTKFDKINIIELNKSIIDLYKMLSINPLFIEHLANNPEIFSRDDFMRLDSEWTLQLCELVDAVEIEDDEEIPDEFLDPIMFCPIKNPVVLPESKTIMEQEVITQHLMEDETDPFNRTKLTIEMLNEFNESEEGQTMVSDFKMRYNEWKK